MVVLHGESRKRTTETPLDADACSRLIESASRLDDRGGACPCGGKSGLHGDTAPDNIRRGRPQGKCHRKQTASAPRGKGERVR
jgi:hypothetical protein